MNKNTRWETSERLGALSHRRYRRFWLGSLASVGGTQLLVLGQGWLVFQLSGSTLDLGLLGAAFAIPAISITLFGGVLADRLDKRKVLMFTSLTTASLLGALALLDLTDVVKVWHVITIAVLIGLVSGLDWPARQALFPALIDSKHMMSAVALNSILWQSTRMVMPAVGGVAIAVFDTSVVFIAAAVGFMIMFFVLLSLDVGGFVSSRGASLIEFKEGLEFIARERLFAVLIPLTWITMLFGTSYIQLMPAFAGLLDVGEKGYGALISISGVGSVTGTILVGPFQKARRLGRLMLTAALLASAALFGFSIVVGFASPTSLGFFLALLCVFLMSVFSSVYLISSMTVLQLRVPARLRGRVMGIHGITFNLIPLGGLLTGAIAAASTPALAVGLGASIVAASIIWVAITQPGVRDLDGQTITRLVPENG